MDGDDESVSERINRSTTWQYFDIEDSQERKAACKACREIFSFRSSISNLRKHYLRKHGNMISQKQESFIKKSCSDAEDEVQVERLEESFLGASSDDDQQQTANDKRKDNKVWDYYDVTDQAEFKATCRLCSVVVSYRSTAGKLNQHLRKRHLIELKNSEDEMRENDASASYTENKKKRKSLAWKYFTVHDKKAKVARCKICGNLNSYMTSISNLVKHVQRKHTDAIDIDANQLDESSDEKSESYSETKKKRKSAAWLYFTVHDEKARIAKCNICGNLNSYMVSISNLMKHVKRKHTDAIDFDANQLDDSSNDNKSEGEEAQSTLIDDAVWRFFKKLDNAAGLAECLLCKKILCFMSSFSVLTKHLSKKHPRVKFRDSSKEQTMIVAGDGQWYEMVDDSMNDNDDNDLISGTITEPTEIYLDEKSGSVVNSKRGSRQRRAVKKRKRSTAAIAANDSSSDEPLSRRVYKGDSLDAFGKYLVSLLRELPLEESTKMQGELIKCVIDKMSLKKDSHPVVLTVRQEDADTVPNATDDHIYVVTSLDEQK